MDAKTLLTSAGLAVAASVGTALVMRPASPPAPAQAPTKAAPRTHNTPPLYTFSGVHAAGALDAQDCGTKVASVVADDGTAVELACDPGHAPMLLREVLPAGVTRTVPLPKRVLLDEIPDAGKWGAWP